MDNDEFWRIVDRVRIVAGNDTEARVDGLREHLAGLEPSQLQQFQNIYDEQIRCSYIWELWGAAYLMNGGCSDDGFRYFRDWLISEGRATFDQAVKNPDSLADIPKVQFAELESFGYVALELYEEKGAGELNRDFSTESSTPAGEHWSEEQLPTLFPRINAVYGL